MDHSETTNRRKLAAILSADAAGYSRMMGENDQETVRALNACREIFRRAIARYSGRVVDTAGDNVLAEFASVVEAVRCAVEVQQDIQARNVDIPEARRMQFRIGVNLGDLIEQSDGSIYGDGVNVAARVQTLAEPGGVCISGTVHDHIESKLPFTYESQGEHSVKNIAKPVRVYRVRTDATAKAAVSVQRKVPSRRRSVPAFAIIIGLVMAMAGAWYVAKDRLREDATLALPTGPSIAVLPFANMSGDPKQDYFADGITEQIITELARFRDLRVIARNSTFSYKGKAVDVRQVGKELGARYVLEGSIRQDAERIRATAQLLDASNGAHLWAETYERQLTAGAIFAVQDEITTQVVGAIGGAYGAMSRATWEQSKSKGTQSLDAYYCVLVTREYWRTNAEPDHLGARHCLEKAVKLDPNYAEAWAMLAMVYGEEHMFGYNQQPDPIGRAFQTAQRAIEHDPMHQRAQESLANVYFYRNDIKAFFPQAEKAVSLNPNNEDTLANMGLYMTYIGMADPVIRERGLALVKKAMMINPSYPGWYHFPTAWSHWWKGEYDQALVEANKINQPDLFWTYVTFAMIHGARGQPNEATPHVAHLLKLNSSFLKDPRKEWRKWNIPDAFVDRAIKDLRRAGLNIPAGV